MQRVEEALVEGHGDLRGHQCNVNIKDGGFKSGAGEEGRGNPPVEGTIERRLEADSRICRESGQCCK